MYVLNGSKTGFNPYKAMLWLLARWHWILLALTPVPVFAVITTGWLWLAVVLLFWAVADIFILMWEVMSWIYEDGPERLMNSLRAKAADYERIED